MELDRKSLLPPRMYYVILCEYDKYIVIYSISNSEFIGLSRNLCGRQAGIIYCHVGGLPRNYKSLWLWWLGITPSPKSSCSQFCYFNQMSADRSLIFNMETWNELKTMEGPCHNKVLLPPPSSLCESEFTAFKGIRLRNMKRVNTEPCLIPAVSHIYLQVQ